MMVVGTGPSYCQLNSRTKQNGELTVGGGCANGDGRGCSWVGVGGRAWAVSDGQGSGLGDCVGVVSLNDSCWSRAFSILARFDDVDQRVAYSRWCRS